MNQTHKTGGAFAAFSIVVFALSPVNATLVQTRVSSATELTYSADVSTIDLLAGKTATSVSGWNLTNDSTVAELNDGIHGGTNVPIGGTWTTVGATATYNLGLGAKNSGYDLTFDANNDGEINLLEYATAQNPNANSRVALTAIRTASAMEVTYTRSKAAVAAGVIFTVEFSDALDTSSWSSTLVTQNILTDNGTQQSVKATIPTDPAIPNRFARLKVTQAP